MRIPQLETDLGMETFRETLRRELAILEEAKKDDILYGVTYMVNLTANNLRKLDVGRAAEARLLRAQEALHHREDALTLQAGLSALRFCL